jgi:hypothetical protein
MVSISPLNLQPANRVAQVFFLEREWAKVQLVGAEENNLGGLPATQSFSTFQPMALIAGFYNIAVMCQAIQQSSCHLGVAKDLGPLSKA